MFCCNRHSNIPTPAVPHHINPPAPDTNSEWTPLLHVSVLGQPALTHGYFPTLLENSPPRFTTHNALLPTPEKFWWRWVPHLINVIVVAGTETADRPRGTRSGCVPLFLQALFENRLLYITTMLDLSDNDVCEYRVLLMDSRIFFCRAPRIWFQVPSRISRKIYLLEPYFWVIDCTDSQAVRFWTLILRSVIG